MFQSKSFFLIALFALSVLCLQSGCCNIHVGVVCDPVGSLIDIIAGPSVSAIYADGYSGYYPLSVASVEPDTIRQITIINMKDFSTAYGGDYRDRIGFAAEPSSPPEGMYVNEVRYQLDLKGWRTITQNRGARDGHEWKFWVPNARTGAHFLQVQYRFADPIRPCLTATREVQMNIIMTSCR